MASQNWTNIAALRQMVTSGEEAKDPHRRNWLLNLSFYRNEQWVNYDRAAKALRTAHPRTPRIKYSSNQIQSRIWIQFAKATRKDPVFKVTSGETKPEAVARVKGSYKMLQHFYHTEQYKDAFAEMLLWAHLTGTGFCKVVFDPAAGDEAELAGDLYRTGTLYVDAVPPFEIIPDPFARQLKHCRWIIQRRIFPLDYTKERFGVNVPAEDVLSVNFFDAPRDQVLMQTRFPACVLGEYWERPSYSKPEGELTTFVTGKILEQGPNPYAAARLGLPFAMMRYLPVPGRFWGDTPVTSMRSVNVMYNNIRSDILDNLGKLTNPILTAPTGWFTNHPEFESGKISILYHQNNPMMPGRIDQLKVEPYPQHCTDMLMRLQQELDDMCGLTEASHGRVPRRARAAETVSHLLEQEDIRLSVASTEYERAIAESMTMVLKLAGKFIPIPLTLRVLGREQAYQAELFNAQDIPPDAVVRVEPGSTLPQTGPALQQLAFQLWDRGVLRDPSLLLRISHAGALEEVVADVELDVGQAQRENKKLLGGTFVEVEDFHNHMVHLNEHNRFRKTVDFEEAPEDARQRFKVHVDSHMQYVPTEQAAESKPPAGLEGSLKAVLGGGPSGG